MTKFHQPTQEQAGLGADLTLRFGPERLPGRVHWPAATSPSPLIFVLGAASGSDAFAASLSSEAEAVVLWFAAPRDAGTAAAALGWAAEHAPDLGGDPRGLVVAGVEVGGGHAVRLALAAREHGWPDLRRQLLVHPLLDATWAVPTSATGLAPATVVTATPPDAGASRYVASLRASGVDVDELRVPYRHLPCGVELDALVRSLHLKTKCLAPGRPVAPGYLTNHSRSTP